MSGQITFFKWNFFKEKGFYLFTFRERGREGEREGEKHQGVVASHAVPTGDLTHNPSIYPGWESNQQPLVCRPALNPLSHTSQSCIFSLGRVFSSFMVPQNCLCSKP